MRRGLLVAALVFLSACETVQSELGVPGGRTYRAVLTTVDGASVTYWRWSPTDVPARKVLVLPELGFDHRLVTPLCEYLRRQGFDVASLDGREVTGKGGARAGLDGWLLDVARVVKVHGPKPYVVAIGLGGEAALRIASLGAVSGLVAINVPLRHDSDNAALRQAMAQLHYDPQAWLDSPYGRLLLGAGRSTPLDALDVLDHLALPVSPAMQADLASTMASSRATALPPVPMDLFVSVKDNLVPTETALPPGGEAMHSARRLGRMEMFERDYGHLDWLTDEAALGEVAPVIAQALEALP